MKWHAASPEPRGRHEVAELDPDGPGFWDEQAELLPELDIEGDVLDQYLDWQRTVMVPFGKRWFAVRDEQGRMLGCGALVVEDDVAYVDDVVTTAAARRRGVASSIVTHLVEEARRAAASIYLLADEPDPIRLYERLGFAEAGSWSAPCSRCAESADHRRHRNIAGPKSKNHRARRLHLERRPNG